MNSFASSDQKDFDQLAAAGNRISHGISNVHNDLNQTNSLIKSGFSQQGGILSTIRSGISNVGQGIAKAYNRNKEDYGVNTQEFSRRVAAMAGGPIGLAVRDVISNSGISIGNVVKKSVGGIANMFHGHRNSETQILDNDLNKLNTLNNRQLRATNEQTEAIRDGNKILGELRNIARGESGVSNVSGRNGTPNVTQRANAASRNAVAGGGSSSTSSPASSVGVGSGSSEVINLLREIADNQKNLKNVFTDPEGKEEPGIFKTLAKDLISMPFGFKYWFSGRYAKDIKRSNNPLETIVNALIKMYEWERIGIDLSRRQLNQLIKAAGGQEQKYVGHEGTMITAVKRASGAIKQGAVKTFGNNAFGRMVGGALSLPLAFLRFGEQDFEDQQYLKAYQVATGLGKSKKKGLSGFFDNITGGDKDLNRILYSERNVRKTIDELLGGDFDNSELNRRTFLHKRSFDKADDKKIQRILRDPELLKALQVLNDYRHDPSADDENIKLDVKDLRRLIAKKIGDYGLDGIHGSRVEANSLLKGIKSKESLLSAKDSDFTIKDLFGELSTSISRRAEDREYIKELEKILNDPDSERSTKLSAAQELERIEAELNKRVLATGGVINRKADIISERTGKKVAEISEKNQKESVIPFDDTPEGVKTLQDLGATISRYISNPNNEKIGKQGEPLLTNNITPVVPIGLTPRIVAKLIKEHPGMITRKNFPKKIDGSSSNSADGIGFGSIFGKVDKGEALDGGKNNEELLIDSETEQTKFLKGIYETLDKKISKGLKVDKKDKSSIFDGTLGGLLGGLGSIAGGLVSGVVGAAGSLISSVLSVAATLARFGAGVAALAGSVYVAAEAIRGIKSLFDKLFPGTAGENPGNVISTTGALLQTANVPKNAVKATATESARQLEATSERVKGVKALEAGANEQVLSENLDTAKARNTTAQKRLAEAKARESALNERYRRFSEGTLEPGEKPPTQAELDAAKSDRITAEKTSTQSQSDLTKAQSELDQFKKNTPKKTRRSGAKKLQELPPEQQAQIKASQRIFQMAGKELPELSTKIRQTEGIIKSAKENPDAFDQEFVKSLEEQLKLLKERYNFVKELGKPISAQAQAEYAQALEVNRAALQLQQSKLYRFGTKALDVAGKFGYTLQALGGTVSLIQHLNNHDYLRAMVDTVNYNPNPAAALTAGFVGADADSSSATLREMYGGRFDPHVASDQVYYGTRAFTPIVGDVMTGAGAGVNALFGRNGRIVAGSMLRNTNTYKLVRAGQDLKGLSTSLETLRLASPAERAAVGFTGRLAKMPLSKLGGPLLQAFMFGLDVKEASTDFSNGDYVGGGLSTGAAIFGGVGLAATLTAAAASGTAAGSVAGPVAIICGIGAALISGIKWGWDRNKTQKAKDLYYKNKSAFTDTRLYSDEELNNELNDFCSENTDILKRGEKQVEIYNRYIKKHNIHPLEEFYHTMMSDTEFLLAYRGLYLSLKRMIDEADRQIRQDPDFKERDLEDQKVMVEMAEHRIYAMMAPLYEEFIKNIASKNSDLGKSIDLSALESALKPVVPNVKPGETYMAAPGWQPRPHFTREQQELKKHYKIFKNPNSYSPEQVSFSTAYIARYLEKMQKFQINYQDQFGDFHGNGQTRDSFFQDILYKYDSKYDDYFAYKDAATIKSDYIKIIRKIIEDDDFAEDFLEALCEFNRITGPFEPGKNDVPIPVENINIVLKEYKVDVYLTLSECYDIAAILGNLSEYIEKIKRNEQGAIYEKARLENEYGSDAFLDAQTENLSLEKNADRQYLTNQVERLKGIIHKYTKDKKPLEDKNGFLTLGYHEEGSVQRAHIPGSQQPNTSESQQSNVPSAFVNGRRRSPRQKKAYGDTDNKPGLFEDSTYISGFLDDGTPVKISKSDNVLLTERLSGFTESGTPFEVGESGPEVISNGTVIPIGDNPEAKIAQDRINRVSSELLKEYKHDADAETGTPAVAEAAANQALQLAAQQPEQPKVQPEQKSPTTPELNSQSKRTQAANEVVQNLSRAANPNKITSKEDRLRFAMENAALAAQQSIDVNVSEINKIADKLFSEVKKGNKDSKGFFDTAKDFFTGNFNFKELLEKGFDSAKGTLISLTDSLLEFDDDFIKSQVESNAGEVAALHEALKANPDSEEAKEFLETSGVGSFEEYEQLGNKEKYNALKKSSKFQDRIRQALDARLEQYTIDPGMSDEQVNIQAAYDVIKAYKEKNKGEIPQEVQAQILAEYNAKAEKKLSNFSDLDNVYIARYLDEKGFGARSKELKGLRNKNKGYLPTPTDSESYKKSQDDYNEGFKLAKKAEEEKEAFEAEESRASEAEEEANLTDKAIAVAEARKAEEEKKKKEEAELKKKAEEEKKRKKEEAELKKKAEEEKKKAEEEKKKEEEEWDKEDSRRRAEANSYFAEIAAKQKAKEERKAQEDHDAIRAQEGPTIPTIPESVATPYVKEPAIKPISGSVAEVEEAKALQAEEDRIKAEAEFKAQVQSRSSELDRHLESHGVPQEKPKDKKQVVVPSSGFDAIHWQLAYKFDKNAIKKYEEEHPNERVNIQNAIDSCQKDARNHFFELIRAGITEEEAIKILEKSDSYWDRNFAKIRKSAKKPTKKSSGQISPTSSKPSIKPSSGIVDPSRTEKEDMALMSAFGNGWSLTHGSLFFSDEPKIRWNSTIQHPGEGNFGLIGSWYNDLSEEDKAAFMKRMTEYRERGIYSESGSSTDVRIKAKEKHKSSEKYSGLQERVEKLISENPELLSKSLFIPEGTDKSVDALWKDKIHPLQAEMWSMFGLTGQDQAIDRIALNDLIYDIIDKKKKEKESADIKAQQDQLKSEASEEVSNQIELLFEQYKKLGYNDQQIQYARKLWGDLKLLQNPYLIGALFNNPKSIRVAKSTFDLKLKDFKEKNGKSLDFDQFKSSATQQTTSPVQTTASKVPQSPKKNETSAPAPIESKAQDAVKDTFGLSPEIYGFLKDHEGFTDAQIKSAVKTHTAKKLNESPWLIKSDFNDPDDIKESRDEHAHTFNLALEDYRKTSKSQSPVKPASQSVPPKVEVPKPAVKTAASSVPKKQEVVSDKATKQLEELRRQFGFAENERQQKEIEAKKAAIYASLEEQYKDPKYSDQSQDAQLKRLSELGYEMPKIQSDHDKISFSEFDPTAGDDFSADSLRKKHAEFLYDLIRQGADAETIRKYTSPEYIGEWLRNKGGTGYKYSLGSYKFEAERNGKKISLESFMHQYPSANMALSKAYSLMGLDVHQELIRDQMDKQRKMYELAQSDPQNPEYVAWLSKAQEEKKLKEEKKKLKEERFKEYVKSQGLSLEDLEKQAEEERIAKNRALKEKYKNVKGFTLIDDDFADGGYEGFSDKPILEKNSDGSQTLSSEAGMEAKIKLDKMNDGGAAFIPMNSQHTTMMEGLQKYIAQGIANDGVVPGDKSYKTGTTYSTDSDSESMKRKLANDLLAGVRDKFSGGGIKNYDGTTYADAFSSTGNAFGNLFAGNFEALPGSIKKAYIDSRNSGLIQNFRNAGQIANYGFKGMRSGAQGLAAQGFGDVGLLSKAAKGAGTIAVGMNVLSGVNNFANGEYFNGSADLAQAGVSTASIAGSVSGPVALAISLGVEDLRMIHTIGNVSKDTVLKKYAEDAEMALMDTEFLLNCENYTHGFISEIKHNHSLSKESMVMLVKLYRSWLSKKGYKNVYERAYEAEGNEDFRRKFAQPLATLNSRKYSAQKIGLTAALYSIYKNNPKIRKTSLRGNLDQIPVNNTYFNTKDYEYNGGLLEDSSVIKDTFSQIGQNFKEGWGFADGGVQGLPDPNKPFAFTAEHNINTTENSLTRNGKLVSHSRSSDSQLKFDIGKKTAPTQSLSSQINRVNQPDYTKINPIQGPKLTQKQLRESEKYSFSGADSAIRIFGTNPAYIIQELQKIDPNQLVTLNALPLSNLVPESDYRGLQHYTLTAKEALAALTPDSVKLTSRELKDLRRRISNQVSYKDYGDSNNYKIRSNSGGSRATSIPINIFDLPDWLRIGLGEEGYAESAPTDLLNKLIGDKARSLIPEETTMGKIAGFFGIGKKSWDEKTYEAYKKILDESPSLAYNLRHRYAANDNGTIYHGHLGALAETAFLELFKRNGFDIKNSKSIVLDGNTLSTNRNDLSESSNALETKEINPNYRNRKPEDIFTIDKNGIIRIKHPTIESLIKSKPNYNFAEGGTQKIVPLASGGVVKQPIIGEKGREAVIPFNDSAEGKQTMMELGGVISDNITHQFGIGGFFKNMLKRAGKYVLNRVTDRGMDYLASKSPEVFDKIIPLATQILGKLDPFIDKSIVFMDNVNGIAENINGIVSDGKNITSKISNFSVEDAVKIIEQNPEIVQDILNLMQTSKGTMMKLAGETYFLDTQAGKIGSEQIIDGLKENAMNIANSNSAMVYKITKGGNSSNTVNNIVYNNPDDMYRVAEGSPRNIRA